MRKIFTLLILSFVCFILFQQRIYSQDSLRGNCLHDNFCGLSLCDTCNVPFDSIKIDKNINYGRYDTVSYYPGDVSYANENDGCRRTDSCNRANNDILHYDVYYPNDYNTYAACQLPAVVFVHGGGFSECAPIDDSSNECIYFAQRGFVVFNISYRIGRRITPSTTYPYFTVQQQLAVYRASQDVRGAIRSIIRRQREQFALPANQRKKYQIDTNYIFLAGASAGSITILNVAYYPTQSKVDSINRYSGSVSISQALGSINANFYYGDSTIDYQSKLKGICDQWGSVTLPHNYTTSTAKNFFTPRIPVICFHGQLDPVVPIDTTPINLAPFDSRIGGYGSTYNVATSCVNGGSFQTDNSVTNGPDFTTYGSYAFFKNILQPLDIPSELYIDCQMHHGLDNDCDTCTFQSDFGTSDTTQADVTRYIVGRASVFFQNIIGGYAQLRQDTISTHKVFVECPNYRTKCNLTNSDPGCHASDNCGDIDDKFLKIKRH